MIKKGIPQEGLKLIACLSMLIDHAAYIFGGALKWRVVGRLAFPIYCFLLAEGAYHTRDSRKYMLRLAVGALISELAFDFSFYGRWTWQYQNVFVTLLLGVLALEVIKRSSEVWLKVLATVHFALLAELLHTDYGWHGVLLIVLFGIVRDKSWKWPALTAGMAVVFWMINSPSRMVFGIPVPIQMYGLASLLPIALYSGEKLTRNKIAQWGFYLFYPVHMVLLRLLWLVLR